MESAGVRTGCPHAVRLSDSSAPIRPGSGVLGDVRAGGFRAAMEITPLTGVWSRLLDPDDFERSGSLFPASSDWPTF